jgi:hypothetical protein
MRGATFLSLFPWEEHGVAVLRDQRSQWRAVGRLALSQRQVRRYFSAQEKVDGVRGVGERARLTIRPSLAFGGGEGIRAVDAHAYYRLIADGARL